MGKKGSEGGEGQGAGPASIFAGSEHLCGHWEFAGVAKTSEAR